MRTITLGNPVGDKYMTPVVIECPDTTHERMTAHDAEMSMLEDERYGNSGIDEDGTLGRY